MTKTRKKLIEVALPLEAINTASAREKSIRHGHPSTLHLWWARRPLAAARAVIFAQMVDDPSSWPDLFPTEKKQDKERQRLFKIIEDLVLWENSNNEQVLQSAREEIWASWRRACAENVDHPRAREIFNRNILPAFHDPFAGGGALPLEGQRLGLESYATDLNPVAVLINKSMIEIPPRFAGKKPVNQDSTHNKDLVGRDWQGTQGLAEDVRHYGQMIRNMAEKRIGNLYPSITVTPEMIRERIDLKPYLGRKLSVIAFLWVRTVKSPNPAFSNIEVPLASTFMLTTRPGKEAYVEPLIEAGNYKFKVKVGRPKDETTVKAGTKMARGANFRCVVSGAPISGDYIKSEGKAGRINSRLMAIVVEGDRGRIYIAPTDEQENIAKTIKSDWKPDITISGSTQYLGIKPYGMDRLDQLFTERQLQALTLFSDLIQEIQVYVESDALKSGLINDKEPLAKGGVGATAYAEAVQLYLSFGLEKCVDYWNSLCSWAPHGEYMTHLFTKQAIPMLWDYAEANPFSSASGNWEGMLVWVVRVLEKFNSDKTGYALQSDAQSQKTSLNKVISTDPPYYDNVPYADLSDFFYVWLRRTLRPIFPELFPFVAVPKTEELVAFAYRHKDGKSGAETFFLKGMTEAMHQLVNLAHPAFPVTIYYAFKQSENNSDEGTTNTGWDTFLAAVIDSGFVISGTWPMRTELANRMRGIQSNALASSIVLVCRRKSHDAPTATRREFHNLLKQELPIALKHLQAGNIAPVDLAQAAIGPGMAVYTKFSKVLDANGSPISVRAALALINQTLDETLAEQEGDFDADTRWALAWFEQMGFEEGEYGVAEQLSKAKNTAIDGLVDSGVIKSGRGKVKLIRPTELSKNWVIEIGEKITAWVAVHRLIQAQTEKGEVGVAEIILQINSNTESLRDLCYRLYTLCERKKRPTDAMPYNALIQSWPEIIRLAQQSPQASSSAEDLFSQE
jgi:putative DNA methylase